MLAPPRPPLKRSCEVSTFLSLDHVVVPSPHSTASVLPRKQLTRWALANKCRLIMNGEIRDTGRQRWGRVCGPEATGCPGPGRYRLFGDLRGRGAGDGPWPARGCSETTPLGRNSGAPGAGLHSRASALLRKQAIAWEDCVSRCICIPSEKPRGRQGDESDPAAGSLGMNGNSQVTANPP